MSDMLDKMGTDGMAWAEEFVRVIRDNEGADPHDTGFMVGWFANAIETGRSAGYAQAIEDVKEALPDFYGPKSPPEEYAPKEYIAFIERRFSGREGS